MRYYLCVSQHKTRAPKEQWEELKCEREHLFRWLFVKAAAVASAPAEQPKLNLSLSSTISRPQPVFKFSWRWSGFVAGLDILVINAGWLLYQAYLMALLVYLCNLTHTLCLSNYSYIYFKINQHLLQKCWKSNQTFQMILVKTKPHCRGMAWLPFRKMGL